MRTNPVAGVWLFTLSILQGVCGQPPPPLIPFGLTVVAGNEPASPSPPPPIPPSEVTGGFTESSRSPPPRAAPPPPGPAAQPPTISSPPSPYTGASGGEPSNHPSSQPSGLSGGAIGGIVAGVVGGVCLTTIAVTILIICRKRRKTVLAVYKGSPERDSQQGYDDGSYGTGGSLRRHSAVASDIVDADGSRGDGSHGGRSILHRGLSWLTCADPRTPVDLSEVKSVQEPPVSEMNSFKTHPPPPPLDESLDEMARRLKAFPRQASSDKLSFEGTSYIRSQVMSDGSSMKVRQYKDGSLKVTRECPCTTSSAPSSGVGSADSGNKTPSSLVTTSQASTVLPELPWSDWELRPEDIEICKRPDGTLWNLGSGAYGTVFKALLDGVQEVAVKVFHDVHDTDKLDMVLREVAILKGCRNRNIVQFLGVVLSNNRIQLVTEFMEAGDLWHAMIAFRSTGALSWYKRGRRIALEVTRGLNFLHNRRVAHFDLKSANILLTRDGTAKISDVGFANILSHSHLSNNAAFTFAWAAPEVLLGEPCSFKADIYSLGVVLWELSTNEQPRRGQLRVCRVPRECPAEVETLIGRCLDTTPEKRPDTREIVSILQDLQEGEPPQEVGRILSA